jgi:hypothetical protein
LLPNGTTGFFFFYLKHRRIFLIVFAGTRKTINTVAIVKDIETIT